MDENNDNNNNDNNKKNVGNSNGFKDVRMYPNEFPEEGQLVVVKVKEIHGMNYSYVELLEYNKTEGMIQAKELTRKRIRSIHRYLRIGKLDVMEVLKVDENNGYVDLSKKYVSEEEAEETLEYYNKSKTVHSILKHVAVVTNNPLIDILKKVAWPYYEDEQYEHALDFIQEIPQNPDSIDLPDDIKDALIKEISHRLAVKPVKAQAEVKVTCFTPEGIDAIKLALSAGSQLEDGTEIAIALIRTPVYRLSLVTDSDEKGISYLEESINLIREEITKRKGGFGIESEPACES